MKSLFSKKTLVALSLTAGMMVGTVTAATGLFAGGPGGQSIESCKATCHGYCINRGDGRYICREIMR